MGKKETEIDKFIDKKCYDAMYSALSKYIENNVDILELNDVSNFVKEPDTAYLIDMEIIKTKNCVIEEDEITFDTIVSCEIEIEETVRRNRETDSIGQWFKMRCKAILDDTIKNFHVSDIEVYVK